MTFAGYVRLGILAIIVGLGGLVLWYRADLATAQSKLAQAQTDLKVAAAENKEKDNTIRTLGDRAAITEDVLRGVRQDIQAITQATNETNQAVNDLGASNADVRAFLDTKLPPELDRLLNKKP